MASIAMHINDIYEEYPDQWVLLQVVEVDELGDVVEGSVVLASSSREEIYDALSRVEAGERVAILFTGEILKDGEAFAFIS